MVLHQVLDGEDGGQVPYKSEDDDRQCRHWRFTWNISCKVSGKGDGGELGENKVGEGIHGRMQERGVEYEGLEGAEGFNKISSVVYQ